MQIATWNVNGIRARLEKVLAWLDEHRPDVVCLQETKVPDDDFPRDAFEDAGWSVEAYGQPTYNGVAIVHRGEATDVRRGFDDARAEDEQARILRATVQGLRVVNVYVPNGQAVGSEKFAYKIGWLERLRAMLVAHEDTAGRLVLLGDFNIAPEDRDVHDPEAWRGSVLCTDDERAQLRGLMDLGLTDTLRLHHREDGGIYSWWDYRRLSFQRRAGLRIDLVLASAELAAGCTDCVVDKDARRGKGTSDHAPVVATFAP